MFNYLPVMLQRFQHISGLFLLNCPQLVHVSPDNGSRPQKKYSVAKIDSTDTYEKGKPKLGGLSDPRMGTMDKFGAVCTTDMCDMVDCPGYFGHIELARPMFHCGFIKTVVRVLRCVSYHNSRLLVDRNSSDFAEGMRMRKPEDRLR